MICTVQIVVPHRHVIEVALEAYNAEEAQLIVERRVKVGELWDNTLHARLIRDETEEEMDGETTFTVVSETIDWPEPGPTARIYHRQQAAFRCCELLKAACEEHSESDSPESLDSKLLGRAIVAAIKATSS